jgi:hypothetical protein
MAPGLESAHAPQEVPRAPRPQCHRHQGRARAQPRQPQPGNPPRQAGGHHRVERFGKVEPGLRHDLCRGAAALRREPLGLRAAVPRSDGQAGCGSHRRAEPRDLHRAEDDAPQPALDRGHGDGDLRLPAPALRAQAPPVHQCGKVILSQTPQDIVDDPGLPEGTKVQLLAPLIRQRKGTYQKVFEDIKRQGFVRVRVDGTFTTWTTTSTMERYNKHDIDVVVDRLVVKEGVQKRLTDSVESCLKLGRRASFASGTDAPGHRPKRCSRASIWPAWSAASLRRAGAAQLLVQQPARRVPEVYGPGIRDGGGPRAGGAGSLPLHRRRRGAAVEHAQADGRHVPAALESCASTTSMSIQAVEESAGALQAHRALWLGRRQGQLSYSKQRKVHETRRPFEGVIPNLERRYRETESNRARETIGEFMASRPCPRARGRDCGRSPAR